ncbi:phosphoribosylformylglycinamidine cyclo-ligase [Chitinivibrio alkaliphilus]|uniref:Phosphoribosylformylglycinamidine cyclo-ligase n=1 Tax=Chitinivibrio alkaliphilus ACht1 TaxID=1313304 RepID=U7D7F0_9BACT|nr:phosphoribosylformylglycinamidine cyclo-ligase [Chitinivibrio alkaliphilus]ERP31032.1 phosphoribosylformylglycinamidine cyclo-ligase [Chitinivibrio alkaliphilus ACht1]
MGGGKKKIGEQVQTTYTDRVVGKFGQFGGMFDVSFFKDMEKPIMVSSVDGVGTKLKVAVECGVHHSVGVDIVNHCIDDILVMGARPLVFLDYMGTGVLEPDVAADIVSGLAAACRHAGIALIGGETAEMPGMYSRGEYDIAGTIVGVVDEKDVVDGTSISDTDVLIGLASSGLHTNGYSLARKIVQEVAKKSWDDPFPGLSKTFGELFLEPHRAYTGVYDLLADDTIKGIAHITGGGFQENLDRVLPSHIDARVDISSWDVPPLFQYLVETGNMVTDEAYRTFNMGIGLVLVVAQEECDRVLQSPALAEYGPRVIGRTQSGSGTVILDGQGI